MNNASYKVEFLNNGFILVTGPANIQGLYDEVTGRHAGLCYTDRGQQLAKFAALGMISEGWH